MVSYSVFTNGSERVLSENEKILITDAADAYCNTENEFSHLDRLGI